MSYRDTRRGSNWYVIAVLGVLFAGLILWFANPLGKSRNETLAQPTAQSTDWALAPQGPSVPVKLPKT